MSTRRPPSDASSTRSTAVRRPRVTAARQPRLPTAASTVVVAGSLLLAACADASTTSPTAGFIVGFAAITAGTILFLVSGDDDESEGVDEELGAIRVDPILAPGYVGVSGTF